MKALKYIAGICLALSLTSCDDFLTKTSPDELTSGNYWRNKSDAESGMAAVYSQMYFGDEWSFPEVKWPVEAYRQDDVVMGSDAQNYQNWVQLRDFTFTNGNSQFTSYWWYYYHGISFANQVMTKVSAMTDAQIDARIEQKSWLRLVSCVLSTTCSCCSIGRNHKPRYIYHFFRRT